MSWKILILSFLLKITHAIVHDKIDKSADDQDKFPSQEKKLSKKKYVRRYIGDK